MLRRLISGNVTPIFPTIDQLPHGMQPDSPYIQTRSIIGEVSFNFKIKTISNHAIVVVLKNSKMVSQEVIEQYSKSNH